MHHRVRDAYPSLSAGRLAELGEGLRELALRLKDEVARLVAEAVTRAVRDALRRLLGTETEEAGDAYQGHQDPDREEALWEESPWQEDILPQPPRQKPAANKRWRHALGAALEAGLWWLGRQPQERPLLTTATVALAAGAVALFAGPTLGACAGVLASTTSLLLTVGGSNDGHLAALFAY